MKGVIPKLISIVSILVGLMVIVGWYLDITVLTSISPEWIRMKFATAVCFVLSGIIVYVLSMEKDKSEMLKMALLSICPMLLVLIMGTLFLGSIFGFQTGMENIAFVDRHEVATPIFQGRPALPTMINFMLIALIGFLYSFRFAQRKALLAVGLIVGIIGAVGLIGYITNIPALMYEIKGISNAIAIHTTTLFALLGVALVFIGKNKESNN